jgi:hypothetical protein
LWSLPIEEQPEAVDDPSWEKISATGHIPQFSPGWPQSSEQQKQPLESMPFCQRTLPVFENIPFPFRKASASDPHNNDSSNVCNRSLHQQPKRQGTEKLKQQN